MDAIITWFGETLYNGIKGIHDMLDICPFPDIIGSVQGAIGATQGLAWLNWFVPVGGLLGLMAVWLVSLGLYYGISILLRWLKVVNG